MDWYILLLLIALSPFAIGLLMFPFLLILDSIQKEREYEEFKRKHPIDFHHGVRSNREPGFAAYIALM